MLFVKHPCHQRLFNPVKGAICHGDGCRHSQRLTCKASLAEEFAVIQNGDNRFLTLLGYNCKLYLSLPEVEQGFRRLSLTENFVVFSTFYTGFPTKNVRENGFPIDRHAFAIRQTHLHLLVEAEP